MKTTHKKKSVSAEAIARLADDGKSVAAFFTNKGRLMQPIQRVNVDFAAPMLEELDNAAKALNISRQAVIKTLIRQALDHHYLATVHPARLKIFSSPAAATHTAETAPPAPARRP